MNYKGLCWLVTALPCFLRLVPAPTRPKNAAGKLLRIYCCTELRKPRNQRLFSQADLLETKKKKKKEKEPRYTLHFELLAPLQLRRAKSSPHTSTSLPRLSGTVG